MPVARRAGRRPDVGFGVGFGGFEFDVCDVEAGGCGGGEDGELGGEGAFEAAAVGDAPAGGDGGGFRVARRGRVDARHGRFGAGEVVEAELKEGGFLDGCGGAHEHLIRGGADDGDADFCRCGNEGAGCWRWQDSSLGSDFCCDSVTCRGPRGFRESKALDEIS